MKVLAVGDIHTKLWIIEQVAKIIGKFDAVVFVGDYADDWGRAPQDSINTWQALKNLQHIFPEKVFLVQGNHDYIYTHTTSSSQGGYSSGTQFLLNMKPDLKKWLTDLPIVFKLDGVTYSHAGVTWSWDGEVTEQSLWNDPSPLWVRPDDGLGYVNTPQVFGHTPSKTCWEVNKNIWCIDTFSTYPDGTPFGDGTVLEITNGKEFRKFKLNDNNSTNSIEGRLS